MYKRIQALPFIVILLSVALIQGLFGLIWFPNPKEEQQHNDKTTLAGDHKGSENILRKPAQFVKNNFIEPMLSNKKSEHPLLANPMQSTSLRCNHLIQLKTIHSKARYLALKNLNCDSAKKMDPIKKIEVINKTNHFNATIFELNDNKYITDFIYLNDGINKIEINKTYQSGKVHQKVLNIRKIASIRDLPTP